MKYPFVIKMMVGLVLFFIETSYRLFVPNMARKSGIARLYFEVA